VPETRLHGPAGRRTFVGYADSDLASPNRRVRILLPGYPYVFLVRVRADPTTGPVLTELTIKARDEDDQQVVDQAAVRSVPVRRLAKWAWFFIESGGPTSPPRIYRETNVHPGSQDDQLGELRELIQQAMRNGEAVRPTVAEQLGISPKTLDRRIAKAKEAGLLEGIELPLSRRPPAK